MNKLRKLLNDPSTPKWMRVAIEHALNADPVDFANQAEFLSQLANEAAVEQLAEAANQSLLRRLESITTGKIFTHAG